MSFNPDTTFGGTHYYHLLFAREGNEAPRVKEIAKSRPTSELGSPEQNSGPTDPKTLALS